MERHQNTEGAPNAWLPRGAVLVNKNSGAKASSMQSSGSTPTRLAHAKIVRRSFAAFAAKRAGSEFDVYGKSWRLEEDSAKCHDCDRKQ